MWIHHEPGSFVRIDRDLQKIETSTERRHRVDQELLADETSSEGLEQWLARRNNRICNAKTRLSGRDFGWIRGDPRSCNAEEVLVHSRVSCWRHGMCGKWEKHYEWSDLWNVTRAEIAVCTQNPSKYKLWLSYTMTYDFSKIASVIWIINKIDISSQCLRVYQFKYTMYSFASLAWSPSF